jgi:hypothetical protein
MASTPQASRTLDLAVDQWALRSLADRYGLAVDARDMDALAELFWPEGAIFTHSVEEPDKVVGSLQGEAAIRGIGARMVDRYDRTLHLVANAVHHIDGDGATGQVYCTAHHLKRNDDGISDRVMFISYDDRYARRDGLWRFEERRLRVQWTEQRSLGERTQLGPPVS